ncbi:hypothetical protein [Parapedobacter tibetensis]|uniref:hypothetical protein n=1 Tax=Parapedobacter tibetensis TaxID=2972951 RepID=UPI00214D229F|nr:hypothetical protein [Parapedobacter tibetensis]
MKYGLLLCIATMLACNVYGQATFHFEKSFAVAFPHGAANQVNYIQLPVDQNIIGLLTVTITGGYNHQLNMGVLKKRICVVKGSSGYFNEYTEILDASGPLATQWHIGDYDAQNNTIPIYHLVSTGNTISIKIDGQMQTAAAANQIQSQLAVTTPMTVAHTKTRQYKSIMQDRVGIGTATPTERLSVNGNIRAKEIKVEVANWPDYVFQPDYRLTSLAELEAYINANGHLPGIPKASEVKAEGVALAEMNRKLLEKVEELTLHLIEKDREMEAIRKEVDRMKAMESRLQLLEANILQDRN